MERRVADGAEHAIRVGNGYLVHHEVAGGTWRGGDAATVQGKVWKRGEPEPAAWTLVVEDPHPIANGSPGLEGYAPVDVFWDNYKVTVND